VSAKTSARDGRLGGGMDCGGSVVGLVVQLRSYISDVARRQYDIF